MNLDRRLRLQDTILRKLEAKTNLLDVQLFIQKQILEIDREVNKMDQELKYNE